MHKNDSWTRKGNKGQKNTNIDIVFTQNMNQEHVQVKYGEYNK